MLAIVGEAAVRSSALIALIWIGLKVIGTNNHHSLISIWRLVLLASLWSLLTVGYPIFSIELDTSSPLLNLVGNRSIQSLMAEIVPGFVRNPSGLSQNFNWGPIAVLIYISVAGWFLTRLAVGIILSWRLRRSAHQICEDWTAGKDVRSSASIKSPGTFGSTILLPEHYRSWTDIDRRAIMVHEESHVRRGDFYLFMLAAINKSVFWFNPLAYWLYRQIVYLSEARSDAAAIEEIEDRFHYAELLVRLGHVRGSVVEPAMARSETIERRVEQLLTKTQSPKELNWKAHSVILICVLPLAAISIGLAAQASSPPTASDSAKASSPDINIGNGHEPSPQSMGASTASNILDNHAGRYPTGADVKGKPQNDPLFIQLVGGGETQAA